MMSRVLNIVFVASIVKSTLNVDGKCEEHFLNPTGRFQSPDITSLNAIFHNANRSSNDLECRWILYPPSKSFTRIILTFIKFSIGKFKNRTKCDPLAIVTIIDHAAERRISEIEYCGSTLPPPYYSKGTHVEVVLKGSLLHPSFGNGTFVISYKTNSSKPITTLAPKCGPCGGILNEASGTIKTPSYPGQYPNFCDCKWTIFVRKGYVIKLKFWEFDLEDEDAGTCHDYLAMYDGSSMSSRTLGKFCGTRIPGSLQTTSNYAFLHFHSDFSHGNTGFVLGYSSSQDEEDLSSLRSIAAILGGVSFGIFIFLLLCSIIYKRYIDNGDRRDTSPPTADNDYLDAVQAAAPPSYRQVMADPEHYPRTPEVTPAASPVVTPSLLRRNYIRPSQLTHDGSPHLESLEECNDNGVGGLETPPPPYPGNVKTFDDVGLLIEDLPPPPEYRIVSNNEEQEDPCSTWSPVDQRISSQLNERSSRSTSTYTQETECDTGSCCSNGLFMYTRTMEHTMSQSSDCIPIAGALIKEPKIARRVDVSGVPSGTTASCLQCIEDSNLEENDLQIPSQRSDQDIIEDYSSVGTIDDEFFDDHQHPNSQPLLNRVLLSERIECSCNQQSRCGQNTSTNSCNSNNHYSCNKKKRSWLEKRKWRSLSVPALAQRHDAPEQNRPLTPNTEIHNSQGCSIFSRNRHNHANRVQPDQFERNLNPPINSNITQDIDQHSSSSTSV